MRDAPVTGVTVSSFTVPTDAPEGDGTLEWDATTIVVAEVSAGGRTGLGYTYAHDACAVLARDMLAPVVHGREALDVAGAWQAMARAVRNLGRPGTAASAIAALDVALWDLKARLLGVPLARLLGMARDRIAVYGSGGFTTYTDARLREQLAGWAAQGCRMVKMKVGADPDRDLERVRAARAAVGDGVELFVDANGAYSPAEARGWAAIYGQEGVTWFEEPVSSDDLEGLAAVRASAPPGIAIAAGEYGYDATYFRRMLAAGAVDVLQADATRCGGITGFMAAASLAEAHCLPLSAHTAPALHTHLCCAAAPAVHLEYFHDHARIERLLFDGVPELEDGTLRPDLGRPGMGLELRLPAAEADAA
jgi:L-alanine-DL-glutamate epimerase-like enolase superfamily enzyme